MLKALVGNLKKGMEYDDAERLALSRARTDDRSAIKDRSRERTDDRSAIKDRFRKYGVE